MIALDLSCGTMSPTTQSLLLFLAFSGSNFDLAGLDFRLSSLGHVLVSDLVTLKKDKIKNLNQNLET